VAQLVVAYWLTFNGSTRQIALIVGDGFKTGDFNFKRISLGAEFVELLPSSSFRLRFSVSALSSMERIWVLSAAFCWRNSSSFFMEWFP
jgi:hypothetical protein